MKHKSILIHKAAALSLAFGALFAFSPMVALNAGPGGIFSKASKVGRAGRADVPGYPTKTGRAGYAGASGKYRLKPGGTAGSSGMHAGQFAERVARMNRARPKVQQRQLGAPDELDALGHPGVADRLRGLTANRGAARYYMGRADGHYYFVRVKNGAVVYGQTPVGDWYDAADGMVGALDLADRADMFGDHLLLEPEAVRHGFIDQSLLKSNINIHVVRDAQRTWATRVLSSKTPELMVVYSPSVLVRLSESVSFGDLSNLDALAFRKDRIRVLSHLDAAAAGRLDVAAKRAKVDFRNVNADSLAAEFEAHAGKTIAIIGHLAHEALVAYADDGRVVGRIALERIQQLADDYGSDVLLLSYRGAGSAYRIPDIDAMPRLARALQAKTVGEFYNGLGTRDNPLILTELSIPGDGVNLVGLRMQAIASSGELSVRSLMADRLAWLIWLYYALGAAAICLMVGGGYVVGRFAFRRLRLRQSAGAA